MTPTVTNTRLLVKPITLEEHDKVFAQAKAMGIALIEKTERQEATIISNGVVVQIGPMAFKDIGGVEQVKIGDRIDYVKHGGMFIVDPDDKTNKWYVIDDVDVLAVWSQS